MKKVAYTCVTLSAISALVAGLATLNGCSAKVEVKSTPAVAASAPEVVASAPTVDKDEKIPVDERLNAILRTDSDLVQVCYDPEDVMVDGKSQHMLGFLIKHRSVMVDGQDLGEGWRYIDKVPFSQTAAGKWYSERANYMEYNPQYPDVTGLTCKAQ